MTVPSTSLGEVVAHILGDLLGETGAAVVHRQEDRRDAELGVQVLLDHLEVPSS